MKRILISILLFLLLGSTAFGGGIDTGPIGTAGMALATNAETVAGTNTTKAVTPDDITYLFTTGYLGTINAIGGFAATRTDAAQFNRQYEATSDGDSSQTYGAPAKGTGWVSNGVINSSDTSGFAGWTRYLIARSMTAQGAITSNAPTAVTDAVKIIPDDTFRLGKTLIIEGFVAVAGTNNTKLISIDFAGAAKATCTLAAATVGNCKYWFTVNEYTDFAHQRVTGELYCATNAGATPLFCIDSQATTQDFAAGDVTVQIYGSCTNNSTDSLTFQAVSIYMEEYH